MRSLSLIFFLLSILGSIQSQTRFYVNKSNGSDLNTGLSWGDAFENVQQALNVFSDDDTIWVAQGTYYPDEGGASVPDDRTSSFYLFKGVNLYGGFQGQEQELDQRDITLHPTILSGDLQQNDGPNFVNNSENSYHVLVCGNQNKIPTIDGFTIIGGHANFLSGTNFIGAGMLNFNADPRVLNCRFEYNFAISTGGGMENSNADTYVDSCEFIGNYAGNGGGMYNLSSTVEVVNSSFTGNTGSAGAGMYNYMACVLAEACVFDSNNADTEDSTTSSTGGGIYNSFDSKCELINNSFLGNYADFGGGLHNSHSVAHCRNNLFLGNHAKLGGGLYNSGDTASLINCTFTGNLADNSGGAIRNHLTSPVLINTLIWNNADQAGVGSASASMSTLGGVPIMTYCLIQNVTVALGGNLDGMSNAAEINYPEFIIPVDPLTVPTNQGNARLLPASLVINMGNNVIVTTTYDRDGNNRLNGDVDFGAYENPLVNCQNHIVINTGYSPLLGSYEAKLGMITAGMVQISSGSIASLNAPCIQLNPDFLVELGGELVLTSESCTTP